MPFDKILKVNDRNVANEHISSVLQLLAESEFQLQLIVSRSIARLSNAKSMDVIPKKGSERGSIGLPEKVTSATDE